MNCPQDNFKYFIHNSSYIDEPCNIGEGTEIWHFSHIMKNSKIGKNCKLGQNTFVGENVSIGNYVKIQNNVSIYEGVTLADEVFCGPSVVFTNVKFPRSAYPVYDKINYSQTTVMKGATIGANATIICGNTLGQYSFISAGSVITTDVPDYAIFIGVPAVFSGWICECGKKLYSQSSGFLCDNCSKEYELQNNLLERVK